MKGAIFTGRVTCILASFNKKLQSEMYMYIFSLSYFIIVNYLISGFHTGTVGDVDILKMKI